MVVSGDHDIVEALDRTVHLKQTRRSRGGTQRQIVCTRDGIDGLLPRLACIRASSSARSTNARSRFCSRVRIRFVITRESPLPTETHTPASANESPLGTNRSPCVLVEIRPTGGMTEPREKKFLFEWRRTWRGEKPFDYSAKDGNVSIGRIYKVNGGPEHDRWHWAIHAFLPLTAEGPKMGAIQGSEDGTADTRDEACRQVEESYLRMRHRAAKVQLDQTRR